MKMYRYLFLGLFCFSFLTNIYSQRFHPGVIDEYPRSGYRQGIIGDDEDYIYTSARASEYTFVIGAYDKKNKNSKVYSIPLKKIKVNGRTALIERVTLLNDDFVIFYSYYAPKTRTTNIAAQIIDKRTGVEKDIKKDIISVVVGDEIYSGSVLISVSEDKSKVLIYQKAFNYLINKGIKRFYLFNENLELLVCKDLNTELDNKKYILDNEGSVYYLKRINKELFIGSFDANREYEKWEEKIIFDYNKFENFSIHNEDLNINKQNELILTGLVGVLEDDTMSLVGVSFVNIDRESKEVKVAKISNFSKDFLEQFRTDTLLSGDEKIIKKFGDLRPIDKSDGSVVCTFENFNRRYEGGLKHVEYGDIIAVNFSIDGNILWAKRIPKNQVLSYSKFVQVTEWVTTNYFSYASAILNDKLILIYNDNSENLVMGPAGDPKKMTEPEEAVPVRCEIDLVTGEMKKEVFSEMLSQKTIFFPYTRYQKEENADLILYGRSGTDYSFHVFSEK